MLMNRSFAPVSFVAVVVFVFVAESLGLLPPSMVDCLNGTTAEGGSGGGRVARSAC